MKSAIKESPTMDGLCQKIAEHKCYTKLVETIVNVVTNVSKAENPSTKNQNHINMINIVVKFIRVKHIKPTCKKIQNDTKFTDFITGSDDETTMNVARNMVNTKIPAEEFVKEWKEQYDNMVRNKNKLRHREYMEKRWGEALLPLSRKPRDPDMSSVVSCDSSITETSSTCPKQQSINYKLNISEITTIQRPSVTWYGADIPKEVLDNIPAFKGKQGELSQFLNTIESYSMMYIVHKTDLVLLQSRGKAHEIISHAIAEDVDVEWSDIKRRLTSNYRSTRSGIKASVKISKLSMTSKETVGEYLARARTLIKSKIKNIAMWNSMFNKADAYHICSRLLKTGLKTRMLRRVSQFKTYKCKVICIMFT